MILDASTTTGIREQKRRETLARITRSALKLFAQQGYEATTLDAIAAEAGISRRTFFHYFKSKDDILLSQHKGFGEQLVEALGADTLPGTPLETVRRVILRGAASYSLEELTAIDRLMLASDVVQARKRASYIAEETLVYDALRVRWPDEPDLDLRLVAMIAIGLSRVTLDAWRHEGGTRPIVELIEEAFAALQMAGNTADHLPSLPSD